MTQTSIPFFFMRGGTSRGPYMRRDDLPEAGLANVTATHLNLMGFEAPEGWEPSLLRFL